MLATSSRLSRLERRMGGAYGPHMLFVVKAGPSNEDLEALLMKSGADKANPNHLIVILRTIYEASDGSEAPDQPVAELLYSMQRR